MRDREKARGREKFDAWRQIKSTFSRGGISAFRVFHCRPPLRVDMEAQARAHLRSLYRSFLRELPPRPLTSPPSPLRSRLRESFSTPLPVSTPEYALARRQEAEQYLIYIRAQRMHATLLERYNPGTTLDEEERLQLTARRVGMEMPIEWKAEKKS